jgi:putative transposase
MDEISEAVQRLAVVNSMANSRSKRRYKAMIREGKTKGLTALESLISNRKAKSCSDGRKKSKRPKCVISFLKNYVKNNVDDLRRMSPKAAFDEYMTDAEDDHPDYAPVTRPTFNKYLAKVDRVKRAQNRGGERAKNAAVPPTDVTNRELTATRPFERVTIDHYKMDIFCEALRDTEDTFIASPWLSVMVDLATSYMLAIWLTFQNPSKNTCACLLRTCARAHGRLPEAIIVDHGSEFKSVYFSAVLSDRKIQLDKRPISAPRFGAEAERAFGVLKTECLNHLPGNYVLVKDGRIVSSTHHAKRGRLLDLREVIEQTANYYLWANDRRIVADNCSSSIIFDQGLKYFPFSGKYTEVNNKFLVDTAVDDKRYKYDPLRGFHIGDYHYTNSLITGTSTYYDTRPDPENPYLVYAHDKNTWIPCYASEHRFFERATIHERSRIAMLESIPHKLKSAQANNATTARIRGIRKIHSDQLKQNETTESYQDSKIDEIKLEETDNLFEEVLSIEVEPLETI